MPRKSIPVECRCRYCEDLFFLPLGRLAQSGRGTYCSPRCYYADRRAWVTQATTSTCEVCGKGFRVSPSVRAKGKGRCCSTACWSRHPDKYRPPPGPRIERACVACGKTFSVRPSSVESGRGRYCSLACWHPPGDIWRAVERRVDRSGVCHMWTGAVTGPGYPEMTFEQVVYRVHRLVLERKLGRPIAVGMMACHQCEHLYPPGDTSYRRCINPDHLAEGDKRTNAADNLRAGRHRSQRGATNGVTDA